MHKDPNHDLCGVPFKPTAELVSLDRQGDCLPGYPSVSLVDDVQLYEFLAQELWSPELEKIAPKLWWMSKVDSGNISPLHRQIVKRRQIIITEEPKLHLVWMGDRIFIKPMPEYLLSHVFWEFLCRASTRPPLADGIGVKDIRGAALGFIRTYAHLIKYESDLRIAQNSFLIPAGISWKQYCDFSCSIGTILDKDVSGRFHFGEIRLSRLNFYAPFLLRQQTYHRVHHQYNEYFRRFYAPLLMVLSVLSVFLSSMQLSAACLQGDSSKVDLRPGRVLEIFFWFGVASVCLVLVMLTNLGLIWACKIGREWRTAVTDWRRFKKGREQGRRWQLDHP